MPVQVFAAADAIIKATKTEIFSHIDHHIKEQSPNSTQQPPSVTQVQDTEFPAGNAIFSDAAWEKQGDSTTSQGRVRSNHPLPGESTSPSAASFGSLTSSIFSTTCGDLWSTSSYKASRSTAGPRPSLLY
jgi:hypothetical protein